MKQIGLQLSLCYKTTHRRLSKAVDNARDWTWSGHRQATVNTANSVPWSVLSKTEAHLKILIPILNLYRERITLTS